MKYVEAGGARLSAIGLGTWQFGSNEWAYGNSYAESVAPDILRHSLDLGVTLIDSAEIYAFGRSEKIVGEALGSRRPEAFVASKLFPVVPVDPVVERRARGSLRRLGIDALDLYQLHWPNPVFPISATMAAMGALVREGLVRHVGVSNYSAARWQHAEQALGGPVLSNQVRYSLIDRSPEQAVLPWAQQNDRIVIAYSPLSQGLLSGRYGPDNVPGGLRGATPPFLPENLRRVAPLLDVLREVASGHDTTCAAVALAWLLRRPNVVVIPGASSVAQAEANAAAADLELTDAEDAALTEASDRYDPLAGAATVVPLVKVRTDRIAGRVHRAIEGMRR
jgi:aryl-alcohol dehydrogenase-like predicted oxidoreductase